MREQDILDQLESCILEMGFGSRDRDSDRNRDSDRGRDRDRDRDTDNMSTNGLAPVDSNKVYNLDHDIFGNTNIEGIEV